MGQDADAALRAGLQHHRAGNLDDAERAYRQVLLAEPAHSQATFLLGLIAYAQGRLDEAEQSVRRAIEIDPNAPHFHTHLGEILRRQGKLDAALEYSRRATDIDPNPPFYWFNLGRAHVALRDWPAAEAALKRAVQLEPGNAHAWQHLAVVYQQLGDHGQVVHAYQRALELSPEQAELHYELGFFLAWNGRLAEGIEHMRRSIEQKPDPNRHSHLLYMLLFHSAAGEMDEVFAEHLKWARLYAEPVTAVPPPVEADEYQSSRRLRIGYASSNFHRHAVASFSEPMLAAHDRDAFEIFCYSQGQISDEVTERFRRGADHWRDTGRMDDQRLAQQIRDDRIDILIDLNGHLPGNRLTALAHKPAPLLVTYLGYQTSTGMSAIDYRLTDGHADPPGTDRFYIEKLFRLPLFFVYRAPDHSPPVNDLPARRTGRVTFGSMNAIVKVSDAAVAAWSHVLQRVPHSRLRLLIPGGERGTAHVRERLVAHGIADERLQLIATTDPRRYLELYHDIDIALDPFPFVGHTTTCDALWMGVPTITLAGEHYFSRMGVSVMAAIAAPEWIASSREEYVRRLCSLAGDLPRLSATRSTLRERLRKSPAMNAIEFTRSLESFYRRIWSEYCAAHGR